MWDALSDERTGLSLVRLTVYSNKSVVSMYIIFTFYMLLKYVYAIHTTSQDGEPPTHYVVAAGTAQKTPLPTFFYCCVRVFRDDHVMATEPFPSNGCHFYLSADMPHYDTTVTVTCSSSCGFWKIRMRVLSLLVRLQTIQSQRHSCCAGTVTSRSTGTSISYGYSSSYNTINTTISLLRSSCISCILHC
jgi:hypothetical protein